MGLFSTRTLTRLATFSLPGPAAPLTTLAWSPTAAEVAVGGYAGVVQLWSVSGAPRLVRTLRGLPAKRGQLEAVQSLAFSPDGRTVAASDIRLSPRSGASDLHLALWRVSNGHLLAPPRSLGTSSAGGNSTVDYSPAGKLLAVSELGGHVLVLDAGTRRVLRTLRPITTVGNGVSSLAFAPNGSLATGDWNGIVQLWNPTTGQELGHPVLVAAGPATRISFDPTGQRFATSGDGPDTTLWVTSTLQELGTPIPAEAGASTVAAFDPSGRNLLVVDDQGHGFVWPVTLAAWEDHACTVAGRNLTREEWDRFVTGYSYTRVCP